MSRRKTKAEYAKEHLEITGSKPSSRLTNLELAQLVKKAKAAAKETPTIAESPPQVAEIRPMYWANPTFFHRFGVVSGLVTQEQREEWEKVTPKASKIEDRLMTYDPIAKRRTDAKKKMRKRAGLKD